MFNPSEVASNHAGREIIKGCAPWLRESDKFTLSVDGVELDHEKGWEWVSIHRPDLAEQFQSLRQIHESLARARWIEIKNELGVKAEIWREDGEESGYIFDWMTVEVLWKSISENKIGGEIESGKLYQELQLIAPNGDILASTEARILEFSRGNYPTGDYTHITSCNLREKKSAIKLNAFDKMTARIAMPLYRISILPGNDPLIISKQTQGFIETPSKAKAVSQFLKSPANRWNDLPIDRVVAETKTEVKHWDIEREMFADLPKYA